MDRLSTSSPSTMLQPQLFAVAAHGLMGATDKLEPSETRRSRNLGLEFRTFRLRVNEVSWNPYRALVRLYSLGALRVS